MPRHAVEADLFLDSVAGAGITAWAATELHGEWISELTSVRQRPENSVTINNLRTLVRAHATAVEELPLVHTSRCEFLGDVARSHLLEPRSCPVFGEKLLYLFYGRPAYRSSKGTQPGESAALCPVCFVFKPRNPRANIARVYPCDSGALAGDLYRPILNPGDLGSLELDPDIMAVRRYVSLFFQTNGNYYIGRVRQPIGPALDDTAARLHELLSSSGPVRYDDRRSAVEVQIRSPIDLRGNLLYVLLPRIFLDDENIRTAIFSEWNCDPIPYPTFDGDSPSAYYGVMRDRLLEALQRSTRV